jgi:DnaJ-class molecular chaperone
VAVTACCVLQAAFRGLALKNHPDHVPEREKVAASARFQKLNEAYSVLRDPVKRRQYDQGS